VRLQLTGQAAVFAPDGKTLALADDRMVECWNLAAEAKIKDWLLPATVTSMVFAPDSRHLAVASSNGAVYIFRLSARGK
jgi:WD40 repeat protein